MKLAQGAQVEIKAGALYRKATYTGVPLAFDVGSHTIVDTVRITWPNGLIQNEVRQKSDAQVKSGLTSPLSVRDKRVIHLFSNKEKLLMDLIEFWRRNKCELSNV